VTDSGPLDPGAVDDLLDLAGGDLDFVDEIADTYAADAPLQVDAIKAAADAGDDDALVAPAHTLKSSSASVGATRLSALARELETAARSGPVPDAAGAHQAIREELDRVLGALASRPWRQEP
jgi:HPt (histidine-containing phosphotransfer) domain-containing protein